MLQYLWQVSCGARSLEEDRNKKQKKQHLYNSWQDNLLKICLLQILWVMIF